MSGASKYLELLWLLLAGQTFLTTGAMAAEKAVVFGTPTANIRGGPGVEHPIKVNLKEGDPVTIEKLEGEWYLVTAPDGQKGYIAKNLVKVVEEAQKAAAPPAKATSDVPAAAAMKAAPQLAPPVPVAGAPQKEPVPSAAPETAPAAPPTKAAPEAKVKSPSIPAKSPGLISLIEGRETETLVCLLAATLAFLLGWLCGGVHALRRDRLKRSRLIF
jgi:uncharacterized protein YgiM (DUF1202 family)